MTRHHHGTQQTPAGSVRPRVEAETRVRTCAFGRREASAAEGVALGPAGPEDRAAAVAMHGRCSADSLRSRYHGPVTDADRYLRHLLDPRHGHTLAARTPGGRIVALGHLLRDGDETEVALLVEDAWQRRGVGGQLLRRLVAQARADGRASVYAVAQASNLPMVAAMRALGLPLEERIEDGLVVVTAYLGLSGDLDGLPAASGVG